jgi:hypothetical protein
MKEYKKKGEALSIQPGGSLPRVMSKKTFDSET